MKILPVTYDALQRPRRHLRHLRGVEGRNIAIPSPHDLNTSACYFTAWQYTGDASLRWVYTSEQVCLILQPCYILSWDSSVLLRDEMYPMHFLCMQVCGGTAPQWARLQQEDLTEVENNSTDRLLSGLLHIHLYLVPRKAAPERPPTPGPAHPTVGSAADDGRRTPEPGGRRGQPSLLGLASGWDEASSGGRLHDSARSSPSGSTADGCPDEEQEEGSGSMDGVLSAAEGVGLRPAGCEAMALPGRLLMSALLDLDALEPLAAAADLDGRALPANTLLIELSDGLYVWPPSQHLQRTASGAVPAAQPAPAPADGRGADGSAAALGTLPPSAWGSPQVAPSPSTHSHTELQINWCACGWDLTRLYMLS